MITLKFFEFEHRHNLWARSKCDRCSCCYIVTWWYCWTWLQSSENWYWLNFCNKDGFVCIKQAVKLKSSMFRKSTCLDCCFQLLDPYNFLSDNHWLRVKSQTIYLSFKYLVKCLFINKYLRKMLLKYYKKSRFIYFYWELKWFQMKSILCLGQK